MKAKLYRRLANKAIKRYSGFDLYKFWHFFKMECDKAIYEISYRTAFEPTDNNIQEWEVLKSLHNIALIQEKRYKPTLTTL